MSADAEPIDFVIDMKDNTGEYPNQDGMKKWGARLWIITDPNIDAWRIQWYKDIKQTTWLEFQVEKCLTTGKSYIQAAVRFKNCKTLSACSKFFGANVIGSGIILKPIITEDEHKNYKRDDRVGVPKTFFSSGKRPNNFIANFLVPVFEKVKPQKPANTPVSAPVSKETLAIPTNRVFNHGAGKLYKASSLPEAEIMAMLDTFGTGYQTQYIIPNNTSRRYDFYIPKYRLLIEYDGGQHFQFVQIFHETKENFELSKRIDVEKTKAALENKYHIARIDHGVKGMIQLSFHIMSIILDLEFSTSNIPHLYLSSLDLYDELRQRVVEGISDKSMRVILTPCQKLDKSINAEKINTEHSTS